MARVDKTCEGIFLLFEDSRMYSIRNQIERAVVSISANIAEGYELQTNKQLIKHLFIAKASCGEVRSLLTLSRELNGYNPATLDPVINTANRLSIMLYNFICDRGWRPHDDEDQ